MEGTPFGQYVLLELLGRGGMGEVWRAHDTTTDRIVALKVLPTHLADDGGFQKRFRREARAAAGLYEPHVVPIHSYGEIDGRLYVDMRLIVGRDLETILVDGPLDPARAVNIIDQVASALQAAHDVGLVHRDVKPSNVIVTSSDFAYLIDFGIARIAGETGITSTGSTIGTWAYMAPERFGEGEPDKRSDVYALACVLHQCLTGQRPFPGERVEQQVAAHLSTPPPKPSVLNVFVPVAFDGVVAQGMAKNPDRRFATTTGLADAARAALAPAAKPQQRTPEPAPLDATMPAEREHLLKSAPREEAPVEPPTQAAPTDRVSAPDQASPSVPEIASIDPVSWAATKLRESMENSEFGKRPSVRRSTLKKPTPTRMALIAAAVLGVVVLVAALVVTQLDGNSPVDTPTFDGTFTADYATQFSFSGRHIAHLPLKLKWVARSSCDRSECIAVARTVDRPEGELAMTFDYVDGRWRAVSEQTDDLCDIANNQVWSTYSLQPQADGSMVGDIRIAATQGGCSYWGAVTFTRIGDVDAGVQVADDPANQPSLVRSPAQALFGHYHFLQSHPDTGEKFEHDYVAQTECLRNGNRCLSYLYGGGEYLALVFSGSQWTQQTSDNEGKCSNGAPMRRDSQLEYPLPEPLQNPITLLTGRGTQVYSGGCTGSRQFDVTLTRTGV